MFLYNKSESHICWILKIHNREDFNRFLVWVILNKLKLGRTKMPSYEVDNILVALPAGLAWGISVNEKNTTIDLESYQEPEPIKQIFINVLDRLEIADYSFHYTPRRS